MVVCSNEIWFKRPIELACSTDLLPLKNMSNNRQINNLTRLLIFIVIIWLLIRPWKEGLIIGVVGLITIGSLYLFPQKDDIVQNAQKFFSNIKNRMYRVESFKPMTVKQYVTETPRESGITIKNGQVFVDVPASRRYENSSFSLQFNSPTANLSQSQPLAGKPNPKTLIPPVMVPPSHDLEYWKNSNLTIQSGINRESQQDYFQSGFETYADCASRSRTPDTIEGFSMKGSDPDYRRQRREPTYSTQDPSGGSGSSGFAGLNVACGYDPKQVDSGLPINYSAGQAESNPVFNTFNSNLYTQNIGSSVYYKNEVNEPIGASIGISLTPQIGKTRLQHDPQLIYTEGIEQGQPIEPYTSGITESDIYDPRFSGYGTSYRSYIDRTTGQPRFMYDDVNSVRMPNYLVRSKIDTQPAADHYGTIPVGNERGNPLTGNMHEIANQSYTDSVIEHRTSMMESLMRKRNSEMWQLRKAPLSRGGQRMMGGMSMRGAPII